MTLNANNVPSTGKKSDPIEAGTYPGRLVGVIDFGLQPQRPYQGQEKDPTYEIGLTYEFVDEFMLDEDDQPDPSKPRWLTEFMPIYPLSADRAKSTLRYNVLDPTGEHNGNFALLIGTAVNITVVNNPGKGKHSGRVFDNIQSISPMRKKDVENCPELVNEPVVFDLDNPDVEVFQKLPPWAREKITSNLEFEGSDFQKLLGDEPAPAKDGEEESVLPDDENPY